MNIVTVPQSQVQSEIAPQLLSAVVSGKVFLKTYTWVYFSKNKPNRENPSASLPLRAAAESEVTGYAIPTKKDPPVI